MGDSFELTSFIGQGGGGVLLEFELPPREHVFYNSIFQTVVFLLLFSVVK